ncbi:MAG: hypothetical protein ACI31E_03460 [Muribaculaceae bacterium]
MQIASVCKNFTICKTLEISTYNKFFEKIFKNIWWDEKFALTLHSQTGNGSPEATRET